MKLKAMNLSKTITFPDSPSVTWERAGLDSKTDILGVSVDTPITKDMLDTYNPQYILSPTTGLDHIDTGYFFNGDYAKTGRIFFLDQEFKDGIGKTVTSTAEHAIGLLIAMLRHYDMVFFEKKRHESGIGTKIHGSYYHVIGGGGRIGKMIASRMNAFGAIWTSIPEEARFLFISIPLEGNFKRVNKAIFKKLRGAYIVNISRRDVINLDDLIGADKAGHFFDYADDFSDSSQIPYTICTPHIGGFTKEDLEVTTKYVVDRLEEHLKWQKSQL